MVETMGPMEFSANTESRKARAATVVSASVAKAKAASHLHNTSLLRIISNASFLAIRISLVPKNNTLSSSEIKASQTNNKAV